MHSTPAPLTLAFSSVVHCVGLQQSLPRDAIHKKFAELHGSGQRISPIPQNGTELGCIVGVVVGGIVGTAVGVLDGGNDGTTELWVVGERVGCGTLNSSSIVGRSVGQADG